MAILYIQSAHPMREQCPTCKRQDLVMVPAESSMQQEMWTCLSCGSRVTTTPGHFAEGKDVSPQSAEEAAKGRKPAGDPDPSDSWGAVSSGSALTFPAKRQANVLDAAVDRLLGTTFPAPGIGSASSGREMTEAEFYARLAELKRQASGAVLPSAMSLDAAVDKLISRMKSEVE